MLKKKGVEAYLKSEKEKLIEEFVPIIKALALKVARGINDETLLEDLVSAGLIGLLEAMERYNPERGIKLKTYAYLRIRGSMIDELRAHDYFPRSARAKAKKIEKAIRELEGRLGRLPEEDEIASYLKLDKEEYLEMLKEFAHLSVISVDELTELSGEDKEKVIRYILEECENPEDLVELKELEKMIAEELEKLNEKQRLVLSLYYKDDLNMKEIAQIIGVTEARVCQIHAQAILNLRALLQKRLEG
ncbi:MAG: FliA/WhiG family RNA polymerase sigma factor [Deltaproteobacteria bacterium]|nr:FliA/WhiG family RNA polymerase sigma factor [Deltaproteobacteria bacterium]